MKTGNRWLMMPLARQCAVRLRALVAPAGMYAYVLSALILGSGAARADDLDVYTKATAVAGGSPVVAMATDTSEDMMCSLLQANCKGAATPADTVLHERSYGMKDALRAVMTSGPSNLRISLTDYDTNGTNDNGRIIQEQKRVGDVAAVLSSGTTFTSPIDKRIALGEHDATQTASGSVRLNDAGITIPVKKNTSPYAGIINSAWTSSGGAGLGGTAGDGVEDSITDPTKYQNAYSNGNKIYYYRHTSSTDLTQTFTLDAATASNNAVLFFIDYYVSPWTVMKYNDDRSSTYQCTNANYPYLKMSDAPPNCYKLASLTGSKQAATMVVNLNSTITMTGLDPNRWYMLVVATRDAGKSGNFTLAMADPSKGTFWDSDAFSSDENQLAGFYFPDIKIPKGASINSAKLVFKNLSTTAVSPTLRVGYDKDVDAKPFSVQDLNSRVGNVAWSGGTRALDPAAAFPEVDVTARLEEAVDRGDWCPGKPIAFLLKNENPAVLSQWMTVASRESDPNNAPRLVVDFDTGSGDPDACEEARPLTLKIGAMSEDTNQFADGTMDVNKDYMPSSGVDAGLADKRGKLWISRDTKVGLRFPLAQIPPGAKILSAKLKLTARGTTSSQSINVSGILDKSGNVQAFFADTKYLDSVVVTSPIAWTPSAWVDGTVYESPDLKTLVQAQISQAGWESENTLGFLLQGTSASVMKACAWEYGPSGGFASTDPAQFGSCAAQLDLVIDDQGNPVTTTYRKVLVDKLMNLKKSGRQPMGGAYLKTARYLAGKFSGFSADGIADQGSIDTGTPVKPTLASGDCASNTIVFISDVNEAGNYAASFGSDYGTFASSVGGSISCSTSGSGANQSSLNCNRALAQLLFDGFTPDGSAEQASIKTFTFNFNATAGGGGGSEAAVDLSSSDSGGGNLRSIAESGGGAFKQSGSSATLVKQLLTVLRSIADSGASVAAPGISVNALNRFEHLDQLYYSLFKPSTTVDWTGNLKRYQLLNSEVADVNGAVAVDFANNAFFSTNARSFWSSGTDGATVTIGGAAAETDAAARRIFTYLGDNAAVGSTTLTDEVIGTNYNVDAYAVGVDRLPGFFVDGTDLANQVLVDARRTTIIDDFLRGTPKYDTSVLWGASIHNSPRIVAFTSDPTNPVITVFYGDNRGFLHAIDAGQLTQDTATGNLANTGGTELMSFIPKELLRNAALFHQNTQSVTSTGYIYGLDGDITLSRQDTNYDGITDKVILFAGMRRGGSNYYAIDVSKARRDVPVNDRVPKLEWVIQGGVGDYAEMGQTWSAMSPNNILLGGYKKNVLVFGGGYDPAYHDDGAFGSYNGVPFTNVDQKGRVLYIADSATGQLIWKSSFLNATTHPAVASMKYSIVATPRLVDRNGDGNYDVIYVVDLAGQVFRFELNPNATSASNLISKVVLVAKLGATATGADPVADNRRFYDSPSIAYSGTDILLGVSSGYREEPGNKGLTGTKEAFFFVKDAGAFGVQGSAIPPTVTMAQMSDITNVPSVPVADQVKPGWYIYFDRTIGEKGIGSPVIFNKAILFASYVVEPVASPCVPDIGKTRLYLMTFDGSGLMPDQADADALPDRFKDLGLPGLADTPQVIFREGGGIDVGVGVKISDGESLCAVGVNCPFDSSMFGNLRRSRWYVVDEE